MPLCLNVLGPNFVLYFLRRKLSNLFRDTICVLYKFLPLESIGLGFFFKWKLFHRMYGLSASAFQCPLSMFCPVFFIWSFCILLTTGQGRPSNCVPWYYMWLLKPLPLQKGLITMDVKLNRYGDREIINRELEWNSYFSIKLLLKVNTLIPYTVSTKYHSLKVTMIHFDDARSHARLVNQCLQWNLLCISYTLYKPTPSS